LKSVAEIGLTVSGKEGEQMLTDAALKHLRPKEKSYKVTDRDGMYVLVRAARAKHTLLSAFVLSLYTAAFQRLSSTLVKASR
jgi:hypothetical protein